MGNPYDRSTRTKCPYMVEARGCWFDVLRLNRQVALGLHTRESAERLARQRWAREIIRNLRERTTLEHTRAT